MTAIRNMVIIAFTMMTLSVSSVLRAQENCDVTTSEECADASKVGVDVEKALRNANVTGLSGLTLKKAVLTLETGSTISGGTDINFFIFTIKHQTKKGQHD